MASSSPTPESEQRAQFEMFFRETYQGLNQYVSRRVAAALVDDVISASFAIAWKKYSKVDSPSLAWLIRIASFEVSNVQRKAWRDASHTSVANAEEMAAPGLDDFDGTVVRATLACLSTSDQEVLRLVHWDGLSRVEIAEILRLTPNAVNVRYHRALKKFEKEMSPMSNTITQEEMQR